MHCSRIPLSVSSVPCFHGGSSTPDCFPSSATSTLRSSHDFAKPNPQWHPSSQFQPSPLQVTPCSNGRRLQRQREVPRSARQCSELGDSLRRADQRLRGLESRRRRVNVAMKVMEKRVGRVMLAAPHMKKDSETEERVSALEEVERANADTPTGERGDSKAFRLPSYSLID
jgi:hypothetical protein